MPLTKSSWDERPPAFAGAVNTAAPEGEASRLLAEDGAGLWVRAGDVAALADACLRLACDDALRARLAAGALAAAPRHTREQQARRFLDVLEQVRSAR